MKILNMYTDQFWKGEVGIGADVEDEGQSFRVRLQVKGDRIYGYSCTCPKGDSYLGPCAHGKALFAYYQAYKEELEMPPARTSQEVWSMIREYTNRQTAGLMAGEEEEQMELVPELLLSGRDSLKVSWRVGKNRQWKIRNLSLFCENVRRERYAEYGKTMGFYHSILAFKESSRGLLSFLLETVGEENHSGELNLEIRLRDRFFGLLMDRQLRVSRGGQGRQIEVRRENPAPELLVTKQGRDGIRVVFQGFGPETDSPAEGMEEESPVRAEGIFAGEKGLYLLFEDRLACASFDYRRIVEPFLNYGAQNSVLTAAARDIPLFYTRVLKPLESWGRIRQQGVRLEDYEPEPLKALFRFDSPGPNEVVMEPILSYGDLRFHPIEDENLPRTLCRDVPGEFRVSRLINRYFRYKDSEGIRAVVQDDEEALYRLLEEGVGEFARLGQVEVSQSMERMKVLPPPVPKMSVSVKEGWLELAVDTEGLSPGDLEGILEAYGEKKRYYRLKTGEFLTLGEDGLKVVSGLFRDMGVSKKELRQGRIRLPSYRALYLDQLLRGNGGKVRYARSREFMERVLRMGEDNPDYAAPESMEGVLRDYQKDGFCWLKALDENGFGGILADDMGLGKTIQVIALLLDVYGGKERTEEPSLVICPASLVYNWQKEIRRFAPELKTAAVIGPAGRRAEILKEIQENESSPVILITSYDLFRRDVGQYRAMKYRYEILDEAQYIKNASTQNSRAVKAIEARTRLAVTGTPMENHLGELWSIFDFLMPGFLFSYGKFHKDYELPILGGDGEALERLRLLAAPFILRRVKEDVLRELPPKVEQVIYAGLEGEQKKLYAAWALRLRKRLESARGDLGAERFSILADLTRLRQICCDPRLSVDRYKGSSAKLDCCMELVRRGLEGGHRILLFSQFTSMLELIEERLCKEGVPFLKLTGATPKEERERLVGRFSQNQEPVFLISLKAGGTGLNLTAADMVIHYDPWWNAAAQDQATDRTHRIGQKRQVMVYRLIAKNTVEENMLVLQQSKEMLSRQLIGAAGGEHSWSREELLRLLQEEPE